MPAIYEIRVKSREGVLQEILTGTLGAPDTNENSGYIALSYVKQVNGVGNGTFVINADSAVVSYLDPDGATLLDAQIEFWRGDAANEITPYCDFYGFLRDREYVTDDNGITNFVAYLDEQQNLMRRAIVAWPLNEANRSLFTAVKASTVMTALATYNLSSSATVANGRETDTDLTGITVEADDDDGSVVTFSCAHRNLLEALQEVGELGGRDFWLEKTGAQAWEFRTDSYLGDDRTGTVTFSLPFGNMRLPSLRSSYRTEKTVAIVGGQGLDSARAVRVRTGTNYNASYNSYEVFVNGSQYATDDGLDTEGDARLEELRAKDSLRFEVIQVPSTLYGKHYFLGDLVSAYYRGFAYTPQIRGISVDVRERGTQNPEKIDVVTANA